MPSSMYENTVRSIPELAVLRCGCWHVHVLLVEPPLTKVKHVPVREHLRYVAHKALCGQGVPPPEGVLAIFKPNTTV